MAVFCEPVLSGCAYLFVSVMRASVNVRAFATVCMCYVPYVCMCCVRARVNVSVCAHARVHAMQGLRFNQAGHLHRVLYACGRCLAAARCALARVRACVRSVNVCTMLVWCVRTSSVMRVCLWHMLTHA